MHPLINLPTEIAGDVFTKWLTLKELLRVDTAYQSKAQRPLFLEILHSPNCVLPKIIVQESLQNKFVGWISKKGIRSSYYEIRQGWDGEYLRRFGRHVSALKMEGTGTDLVDAAELVSIYCQELRVFECYDCLLGNSLCRILSTSCFLKELRLDEVGQMQIDFRNLLDISCPSIDTLRLSVLSKGDNGEETALVAAFVSMCPNLSNCAIHEFPPLEHCGVKIFPERLHKIQRLALTTDFDDVQVSGTDLFSLAKCCPQLEHLDVTGSQLTDTDVYNASFHLSSLRSICLIDTKIGDGTVMGLARMFPHLKAVFLSGANHTISAPSINHLLSECPGLTTLDLNFPQETAYNALNLALFVNITTLHVHNPPSIFLATLPQHCHSLRKLYCSDIYTTEGLEEVVMFCSNLRYLCCFEVGVWPFTLRRWKLLRPDVYFTDDNVLYVHDALAFQI